MNNNGIENFYLSDAIEVIEEVLHSGGTFRLYPRGVSMLPLIRQEKDSVVLQRREEPPKKNEIAFYRRKNGAFVLHRIMEVEKDGSYTMCGDNQLYLERGIQREAIIAVVSSIYRGEKELRLNTLRYRLYTLVWRWMFLRRVCFFALRVFRKIFKKK